LFSQRRNTSKPAERNKEDTITVLFLPNSGKAKGDSPKKSLSGALKSISGKLKPKQRNIKEDSSKSKSISTEIKAIKS